MFVEYPQLGLKSRNGATKKKDCEMQPNSIHFTNVWPLWRHMTSQIMSLKNLCTLHSRNILLRVASVGGTPPVFTGFFYAMVTWPRSHMYIGCKVFILQGLFCISIHMHRGKKETNAVAGRGHEAAKVLFYWQKVTTSNTHVHLILPNLSANTHCFISD